ncbi:hypothetical protein A4X13_0g2900 [Tilletia indica]|uniref:Uncharacterized protein n=1 Tax=Tilletia indica TaxID=43049 RepID=A0A177T5W4_9BASI|nr:hypothetical protein A4X13_0g2900 [Tilletia indica]
MYRCEAVLIVTQSQDRWSRYETSSQSHPQEFLNLLELILNLLELIVEEQGKQMSAVKTHSGPSRRAKGKTQQSAPGAGASASTTKQTPAASTTTTTAQASTTSHPRTAVYRPLLASPFTVTWPTLSLADAEPLLHTLLEILVEHRIQLRDPPAKVTPKKKDKKKKAAAADPDPDAIEVDVAEDQPQEEELPCIRPPWLHVGINAVNQSVEQSIATSVSDMHKDSKAASNLIAESGSTADATMSGTEPESADADAAAADPTSPTSLPKMRFLFVCRADVDPPRLVAHLPMLTCTLNAISSSSSPSSTQGLCLLLPFSRDAELKIATQLKIRRCAVLGISEDAPSSALERLDGVLGTLRSRDAGGSSSGGQGTSALSPLRAPWLDAAVTVARSSIPTTSGGSTSDGSAAEGSGTPNRSLPVTFGIPYVSTSINNLTTSVPSDMNAARTRKKESRKGRKAAAALKKEAEGQRKNGAMKVGARSAKAQVLGKETGKGKGDAKKKKEAQGSKGTATAKGKASEKSKNGTATKSAAGSAGAKLSESQRRRLRRQRLAEAQAGEKEKATEPQQKTKQITAGKKQGTANAKGDKKGPNGGETSAKEKGKQKGSEPNGKKADTTGKKGTAPAPAPAAQQDKTTTPSQSKAAKQKQKQQEKPAAAGGTVPIAPKEAGQKRKRTDAVEGGADASTTTNGVVKNPVKAGKSKGGATAGVVPKGNKANPAELGGGGGGPTSKKKRVEPSGGAVKSTAGVAATEGSAKTVVGKAPVGAAANGGQKKKDGQSASTGAGGGKGKEDGPVAAAAAATKAP